MYIILQAILKVEFCLKEHLNYEDFIVGPGGNLGIWYIIFCISKDHPATKHFFLKGKRKIEATLLSHAF